MQKTVFQSNQIKKYCGGACPKPLKRLARPALAAYFDNSAVYSKPFWQPCTSKIVIEFTSLFADELQELASRVEEMKDKIAKERQLLEIKKSQTASVSTISWIIISRFVQ